MIRWSFILGGVALLSTVMWFVSQNSEVFKNTPEKWALSVQPGELSKFHSKLENSCNECHAPYRGVIREQCVTCHAAQSEILKKQNTSFHGSITSCTGCHFEHQGKDASITTMDHTHLALVATEMLRSSSASTQNSGLAIASTLATERKGYHGPDAALEKALNCATCHENQDPHRSLFGTDCSSCHETVTWNIKSYRHPRPTSRDCSQCHQGPPSHYMMHFKMISERVAGVEHTQVNDCFVCHQTTAWNDIKGVGWYKHH